MTVPLIEWHCAGMAWHVRYETAQRRYSARVAMGMDGVWIGKLETTGGLKDRKVKTYQGKTFEDVRVQIDAVFIARTIHL